MAFVNQNSHIARFEGGVTPAKPPKPASSAKPPKENRRPATSGSGHKKPSALGSGGSSSGKVTYLGPTASERAKIASINAYKTQLGKLLQAKQQSLLADRHYEQERLKNGADMSIREENARLSAKYDTHSLDARDAYISYMQRRRTAGQKLASQGITGGSETGYLQSVDRNYSTALDDIWTSFSKEKQASESRVEQLRQRLAQQLADAEQRYQSKWSSAQQSAYKSMANLDRQLMGIQGKYW